VAENFTAASQLNGAYSVMDDDWSSERVVYRHEQNRQACVWWHKQHRHWWIGDCRKKGLDHGYAWLEPDLNCPSDPDPDGESPIWRRDGTDEVLPLVAVRRGAGSIPIFHFGTPEEEKGRAFWKDAEAGSGNDRALRFLTPFILMKKMVKSPNLA
jgi:hypothetical protein